MPNSVAINDDKGLEREADIMGSNASSGNVAPTTETTPEPSGESEGDSVYVL
ncbi:hypothetical protein [Methylobacter sp.]|uniref:hypothetical protein n=1 Tax=Methylobacter sp. TaxID=2051955 RepID=UPI002FDD1939